MIFDFVLPKGGKMVLWVIISLVGGNIQKDTLPKVYTLPPIVVTATRVRISLNPPVSSSSLLKEEIERVDPDLLDQAISLISGVCLKRSKGMADIMPRVYLRGFGIRSVPGPGSRALLLLDGIPISTWYGIPFIGVERVEVVKGPYSSLYGTNAMGGVVNIITKVEEGMEGRGEMGEEGTYLFDVNLGKRIGKIGFYGSLGTHSTQGYISNYVLAYPKSTQDTTIPLLTGYERIKDPRGNIRYIIGDYGRNWYRDIGGLFKILYQLSPHTLIGVRTVGSVYGYGYKDGRSWLKTLDGKPAREGDFRLDDSTKIYISENTFHSSYGGYPTTSLSLFLKSNKREFTTSMDISLSSGRYWYASPYSYISETSFWNNSLSLLSGYNKEKGSLLFGLEGRGGKERKLKQGLKDWEDPESREEVEYENQGTNLSLGAFTQLILKPFYPITLYLGLRNDLWLTKEGRSRYKRKEGYIESSYPEKEEMNLSPRIGFRFSNLYLSFGKSFRAPTEYELYNEWAYFSTLYKGNPDLKPEKGWVMEMGLNQNIRDKLFLNLSLFSGKIEDMIGETLLDSASITLYNQEHNTDFKRIKEKANIEKVDVKGLELGLRFKPLNFLTFEIGFDYNDMEVIENPEDTSSLGKQLTGMPRFNSFGNLFLSTGRFTISLFINQRSKVYGEPDNSDTLSGVYTSYDPYTLIDIGASYRITSSIRLRTKVSNLLNREYYDYYLMPKRRVKAGIGLRF